jgi:hypothetical protein
MRRFGRGGGNRRSDFVSVNLDDDFAAITHGGDPGIDPFAAERSGNRVANLRQLPPHNVTERATILAMELQGEKRPHGPLSDLP